MRTIAPRRLAVTAALVVGAFTASLAVAQWATEGAGEVEADSLSAVDLTVTARTGTADLYPGFADGDVFFTVTNANPYPVTLTGATFGTVTSSNTTACPSSNVTVDATSTGLSLTVPANSNAPHTIADVVTMAAAAPDGCQAKAFTIGVTLTGSQV